MTNKKEPTLIQALWRVADVIGIFIAFFVFHYLSLKVDASLASWFRIAQGMLFGYVVGGLIASRGRADAYRDMFIEAAEKVAELRNEKANNLSSQSAL